MNPTWWLGLFILDKFEKDKVNGICTLCFVQTEVVFKNGLYLCKKCYQKICESEYRQRKKKMKKEK